MSHFSVKKSEKKEKPDQNYSERFLSPWAGREWGVNRRGGRLAWLSALEALRCLREQRQMEIFPDSLWRFLPATRSRTAVSKASPPFESRALVYTETPVESFRVWLLIVSLSFPD